MTPDTAVAGASVTLTGKTLVGVTSVKVNGVAAPFVPLAGGTQLRLTVPATATSGAVTVTNAGGTTSAGTLTVTPKVTSFSPASGVAGATTPVTIAGSGFTPGATVTFQHADPVAATYVSPTVIRAAVPKGALSGQLTVTTGAGDSAPSAASFTVTFSAAGVAPTSAPEGEQVAIAGVGFTGVTAVRFGGVAATFTVDSPNLITATVPAGAVTGPVTLATGAVTTASAGVFTVALPDGPPAITSALPSGAPVGAAVAITGTNLDDVESVTFGGTPAVVVTIESSTRITATVPDGAGDGIEVTAPDGSDTTSFTLQAELALSEVDPGSGLLELSAVAGGSLDGVRVLAPPAGATPLVLATLPDLDVEAGDLVVVHFAPPAGVTAESTDAEGCADAACYPGAWDVLGAFGATIPSGNAVLGVASGLTVTDAVPFTDRSTTGDLFVPALRLIQAAGLWSPDDCGGAPCGYATTPSAQDVSVPWPGIADGESVSLANPFAARTAAAWAVGPSSFGASNPG
jgi:hypothetical protein